MQYSIQLKYLSSTFQIRKLLRWRGGRICSILLFLLSVTPIYKYFVFVSLSCSIDLNYFLKLCGCLEFYSSPFVTEILPLIKIPVREKLGISNKTYERKTQNSFDIGFITFQFRFKRFRATFSNFTLVYSLHCRQKVNSSMSEIFLFRDVLPHIEILYFVRKLNKYFD